MVDRGGILAINCHWAIDSTEKEEGTRYGVTDSITKDDLEV